MLVNGRLQVSWATPVCDTGQSPGRGRGGGGICEQGQGMAFYSTKISDGGKKPGNVPASQPANPS